MPDKLDEFVDDLQQQVIEEAREKYSESVVQRWVNAPGHGRMATPDGRARVTGPCGDSMEIFLRVEGRRIAEASFLTDGCMTTIVSASMVVEMAAAMPLDEARSISQQQILAALGGLPEESHHCALLAANTLRAAVEDYLARRRR
jgi:NifU-like protein involved in Fe-S cluster formation